MKTIVFVAAVIIVITLCIRRLMIMNKRSSRKMELAICVGNILDSHSSKPADIEAQKAIHIVEHYGIKLSEVGYNGQKGDLLEEASKATGLQQRKQKLFAKIIKERRN